METAVNLKPAFLVSTIKRREGGGGRDTHMKHPLLKQRKWKTNSNVTQSPHATMLLAPILKQVSLVLPLGARGVTRGNVPSQPTVIHTQLPEMEWQDVLGVCRVVHSRMIWLHRVIWQWSVYARDTVLRNVRWRRVVYSSQHQPTAGIYYITPCVHVYTCTFKPSSSSMHLVMSR